MLVKIVTIMTQKQTIHQAFLLYGHCQLISICELVRNISLTLFLPFSSLLLPQILYATLPTSVLGSSSRISISVGRAYFAICFLQCSNIDCLMASISTRLQHNNALPPVFCRDEEFLCRTHLHCACRLHFQSCEG